MEVSFNYLTKRCHFIAHLIVTTYMELINTMLVTGILSINGKSQPNNMRSNMTVASCCGVATCDEGLLVYKLYRLIICSYMAICSYIATYIQCSLGSTYSYQQGQQYDDSSYRYTSM